LEDNLADFTAFDATIDATYLADYRADILAADTYSSDDQVIDIQRQATEDVETQMVVCRDTYIALKYFIDAAFGNKPIIKDEFGFNDYEKVRSSAKPLNTFMDDLHATAVKYTTQLVAKGCTAGRIADIKTQADALSVARKAQRDSKVFRGESSGERVALLNNVYDRIKKVCTAGKVIYANNPIKYKQFLLPWGDNGENVTTVTGTIAAGESKNVPLSNLEGTTQLQIDITNSTTVRLCGSAAKDTPCEGGDIFGGPSTNQRLLSSLSSDPNPKFLTIRHNVMGPSAPDCTYTISIVLLS